MPKRTFDFTIFVSTLILALLGVIMVFSASYYNASFVQNGSSYTELKSQAMWAVLGLILMIVLSKIDYHIYKRFAKIMLFIGILLLIAVLVINKPINNARRWIVIGPISLQPAEVVKLCMILFMARSIEEKKGSIRKVKDVVGYILLLGVIVGLLYMQPNLSMALIITSLTFVMLFIGGISYSWIAGMGLSAASGLVALIFWKKNYWFDRINSFRDIFADPLGEGYQVIQSLYALGAGGLFGLGLGESRQKYKYLPYSESDFIFAIIGEELGFIGATIIIIVFGVLVWRLFVTGSKAPDLFGSMIACGVGSLIAIQSIINIAVVSHTIPATGVPLPFISAGGSSLAVIMGGVGIALNVSRQIAVDS